MDNWDGCSGTCNGVFMHSTIGVLLNKCTVMCTGFGLLFHFVINVCYCALGDSHFARIVISVFEMESAGIFLWGWLAPAFVSLFFYQFASSVFILEIGMVSNCNLSNLRMSLHFLPPICFLLKILNCWGHKVYRDLHLIFTIGLSGNITY